MAYGEHSLVKAEVFEKQQKTSKWRWRVLRHASKLCALGPCCELRHSALGLASGSRERKSCCAMHFAAKGCQHALRERIWVVQEGGYRSRHRHSGL